MGQLRAEIVNRIEKLKVPEMDVINKIPINYKENRSLKISFNAIPLWLCNPNGLRKPFKFCTFSCAISQNVLYFFKKTFLRKLSTVSDLVFLKKNSEMNTTKNSSFLSLQTKCLLFFFPHSIIGKTKNRFFQGMHPHYPYRLITSFIFSAMAFAKSGGTALPV